MEIRGDGDGFLVGSKLPDDNLNEEMQEIRDSLDNIETTVSNIEGLLKKAGALLPHARQKQEKTTVISPRSKEEKHTNSTREKAENKLHQTTTQRLATPSKRSDYTGVGSTGVKEKPARRDSTLNQSRAGTPHDAITPKNASNGIGGKKKDATRDAVASRETDGVAFYQTSTNLSSSSEASKPSRSSLTGAKTGGNEVIEPRTRDAKGRFIGKGGSSAVGGNDAYGSEASKENRSATLLAEKLAEAVKDGTESVGDADPTVQAMNEIAQPVSRGFEMVKDAWGTSEESGWLRKILKSLGSFRKEQTQFNKAEKRALESIDENTEKAADKPVSEGGGLSIMGGLGGKLASIAPMLGAFAKRIPVIGAAFAGFKGIFDFFDSELDSSLSREEKDKKSGKAIGGASGTIAGGFAGAKAGAAIGTMFGGPVGTAIGGLVGGLGGMFLGDKVGDVVGEKMGEVVSYFRELDIKAEIANAFNGIKEGVTGAWNTAVTSIQSGWNNAIVTVQTTWESVTTSVSDAWNSTVTSVQNAWTTVTTGISDAWTASLAGIQSAWDSVTTTVSTTWNDAIQGVSDFWDKAKEGASKQIDSLNNWLKEKTGIDVGSAIETASAAASNALQSVKGWFKGSSSGDGSKGSIEASSASKRGSYSSKPVNPNEWKLGETSEAFESGGKGAGTISSGVGDYGGVSYGTYQLASNNGRVYDFLNKKGYADKFKGASAGTKEFNKTWKELAHDPEFAKAQHEYIKETHYDKAQAGLAEQGIDLSKRGKAVQDMLWSTSVQFGAGTAKRNNGAVGMINKALAGRDIDKMSDEEIITAVQDYKLSQNDKLFKSSSANVRAGTAKRAVMEKERLLKLARAEQEKGPAAGQATLANVGLAEKKEPQKGMLSGQIPQLEERPEAPKQDGKGPTLEKAEQLKAANDWEGRIVQKIRANDAEIATKKANSVSEEDAIFFSDIGTKRKEESDIYGFGELSEEERRKRFNDGVNAETKYFSAPKTQPPAPSPVPEPAPSEGVQTPMASNDKQSAPVVKVDKEAGQDVRDRSIAHIATGGFSGGD